MSKGKEPKPLNLAKGLGILENEPRLEVGEIIQGSIYYAFCTHALADASSISSSPYELAYEDAQRLHPLVSTDTPYPDKVIYAPEPKVEIAYQPPVEAKPAVAKPKPVKKKRFFRRRAGILLLLFVLSLMAVAIPIVSALKVAPEYVDIGTDIFSIADLFQGEFALNTITDNLPLVLLALYLLFALILFVHSLIAILGNRKKHFGVLVAIVFILALAFIAASFSFDIELLSAQIKALDYGIYALAGCVTFALILSMLAYKRIK